MTTTPKFTARGERVSASNSDPQEPLCEEEEEEQERRQSMIARLRADRAEEDSFGF